MYLYEKLLHNAQAVVLDTPEVADVADVQNLRMLVVNAHMRLAKAKAQAREEAKERFGNKQVKQEVKQAKNKAAILREGTGLGPLHPILTTTISRWLWCLQSWQFHARSDPTAECLTDDRFQPQERRSCREGRKPCRPWSI